MTKASHPARILVPLSDDPPDAGEREALQEFLRLKRIMARLRDPRTGCPWDVEQTFATIAPYTIEEAYEVADAIAEDDRRELCEELGDLQLQVVFHARMAEEEGSFALADVLRAINDKMIRRHPHVFGDADRPADAAAQTARWQELKARERGHDAGIDAGGPAEGPSHDERPGLLDDVPRALPALIRARKLQERAARIGFDWPQAAPVLDKVREEMDELEAEVRELQATTETAPGKSAKVAEELGDLLFTIVNLARHLDIDPESALDDANRKFIRRFKRVERKVRKWHEDEPDRAPGLERLERWWRQAKDEEARD